jgi:hypothetical protein
MGVEEHGDGRQLIRFRLWPWCSSAGVAVQMVLAILAMAALRDGAWIAGTLLGAMVLWPLRRTLLECGVARSVIVRSLERFWPEGE